MSIIIFVINQKQNMYKVGVNETRPQHHDRIWYVNIFNYPPQRSFPLRRFPVPDHIESVASTGFQSYMHLLTVTCRYYPGCNHPPAGTSVYNVLIYKSYSYARNYVTPKPHHPTEKATSGWMIYSPSFPVPEPSGYQYWIKCLIDGWWSRDHNTDIGTLP